MGKEKRLRILCCREIQNSIKDSVKKLLEDKIEALGLRGFYSWTQDEIRGANGTVFLFKGLRHNPTTVKSLEGADIVWVEEAQSVSEESLDMLRPTVRKKGSEIWFTWNPDEEDDPIDKMFRNKDKDLIAPGAIIVQVNWDDNPFFTDELRVEMEWDKKRDYDKYRHIWLGEYLSNSEARVFKNWRVGSHAEFDKFAPPGTSRSELNGREPIERYYFGGDFGFANDPTVLVRMWVDGRKLYIDKEVVKVGVETDLIPFFFCGMKNPTINSMNLQAYPLAKTKDFRGIEGCEKWPITMDSARPETISYLKRHGLPKVEGAKKGQGSVEDGIEFLKAFDIIVHPDCRHCIDELSHYRWKTDKKDKSIILPVLEDAYNHVIDSIRYALESTRRIRVSSATVHGLN
jgi:phage terminase large subunit